MASRQAKSPLVEWVLCCGEDSEMKTQPSYVEVSVILWSWTQCIGAALSGCLWLVA